MPQASDPRGLPIYAVVDTPLTGIPSHASEHHVASCGQGKCDVWARTGRYLGQVDEKECDGWPKMGITTSRRSPSGALQFALGNDGRFQLRTRDAAVRGVLPADCDAIRAAWAPDEKNVVVSCGARLRVFDTVALRQMADLAVPKEWGEDGANSLVYSREVRFIVRANANTMTLWQWVPGHAVTKRGAMWFAFDPVTRETWEESIGMSSGRILSLHASDPAPGRAHTLLVGRDLQLPDSRALGAWNTAGTAFTFVDAIDGKQFSVGAVSLVGPSPKGTVSFEDDPALHGSTLSQPTPNGDRAVVVTWRTMNMGGGVEGVEAWLLTPGENRRLRAAALTSAPLRLVVDDERARIVTETGILVVPLDGRSEGVWMSAAERQAWRDPATTRRFETKDGRTLRRIVDGATMNATNHCYWPGGWPDADQVDVRMGSALDGRFLPSAVVARMFCAATVWDRFLKGEAMPPRPAAFITAADAASK